MSHYHSDPDGAGISVVMFASLLVVLVLAIAIIAFAWVPWNNGDDNIVVPGQGGNDPPVRQGSPVSTPSSAPTIVPTNRVPR
jgi:hypothetical protein